MENNLELPDLCKEIIKEYKYLNLLDTNAASRINNHHTKQLEAILEMLKKTIERKEKNLGIYNPKPTTFGE